MTQWQKATGIEMDKTCHVNKKVLDDLMGGEPSPGGNHPTLESLAQPAIIHPGLACLLGWKWFIDFWGNWTFKLKIDKNIE